jgi:aminopeptidase N
MDSPIFDFFAYLSARYAVKRDRWKDVAIEIDYHPGHPYNVDRMIDAVKKSLDYYTANFGPYQHRQVRIVEFPRFATFAQSFPNTIPFSESIGFIARVADRPDAIDYVFYVTAHEVAHQWWAHQVMGGNVQGATLLSETMSQYSALMVMEHEYGRDKMRKFLKYEMDNYLRSRGGERIEELPLFTVENQPYIHYRKGSVVMYALRDAIGEEPLNRALGEYVKAVGFQEPPYTTSLEFLDYIRRAVPEDKLPIVEDLFKNITLYENRATSATWTRRGDGKYVVKLEVASAKFHADGSGVETAAPLDDWIDVGVFGAKDKDSPPEGKVLLLEKRRVDRADEVFELVVDQEPKKAGIDPYNKLIDRNPENNIMPVSATAI